MMLSIEDFLALHRKKLHLDKEELVLRIKKFIENYNVEQEPAKPEASKKVSEENSHEKEISVACSSRNGSPMITSLQTSHRSFSDLHFEDDEPTGLRIGGHEEKRKKLAEERKADYNKFLIEKEKQMQLKKESLIKKKDENASTPKSIASMNYQEVLQRKKEEEKKYRTMNLMDPVDDSEIFRLQSETQKLKSERDNLTMLVNNLKRFAESESAPSSSQQHLGRSVHTMNPVTVPYVNSRTAFPLPPTFPNVAQPPATAPFSHQNSQGYQPYFETPNPLNYSLPPQLPSFERMPNNEYISQAQPNNYPVPSSFDNSLFTGHMVPPAPKHIQYLSNSDYIRELEEQIKQKQLKKMKETEEEQQRQKEIDFFPWGNTTGGGGAPMKDASGNVVTSRKGMQILSVPTELGHPLGVIKEKPMLPVPNKIVNNVVRHNDEYEAQIKHDRYREDLRRQIEDKRRLLQQEKENERLEEERLAQRIEEQRIRMQREYDEEQAKRTRKEEELRLKQERLMQLQLEQRQEQERKKQEAAEMRERERLEKLKQEQLKNTAIENEPRNRSPPVPTVRTMNLEKEKPLLSEAPSDPRQNVLSQLTQLRQQLQDEQQKMDANLKEQKKKYKVMDRRAVHEDSDDNDEEEVHRLRRNRSISRESSADSREYTEKSSQWNKENIKYHENFHRNGSDVRVENLD